MQDNAPLNVYASKYFTRVMDCSCWLLLEFE